MENFEIEFIEDIQVELLEDMQIDLNIQLENIPTPKTNKQLPFIPLENVSLKVNIPVLQHSDGLENISTPKINEQPSTSFEKVSPKDIIPVPQQNDENRQKKRNIRRGKTVVLTSSPYKNDLVNQKENQVKHTSAKKQLFSKKIKTKTKTDLKKKKD